MKRIACNMLVVLGLALCSTGVTYAALATITEQLTAGHGPGPNGGSNGLYANHNAGESLTDAWIAGVDGPYDGFGGTGGNHWGELETHTPGVEVTDSAWARDGNWVTATTQAPLDTYWTVDVHWLLRGQVTTKDHWGPDKSTDYSMQLWMAAETDDVTGNWSELDSFSEDQRIIMQETSLVLPFTVATAISETTEGMAQNPSTVTFGYAIEMWSVGSISRGEMKVRAQARVDGPRDPLQPHNGGQIKLMDSSTMQVIAQSNLN